MQACIVAPGSVLRPSIVQKTTGVEVTVGLLDSLEGLIAQHATGAVSHEDATAHHEALAAQATPEQYQSALNDAVAGLAPEHQAKLGTHLQDHATANGFDMGVLAGGGAGGGLGGLLGGLLGGRSGASDSQGGGLGAILGGLKGPVGSVLLTGIVASLAKQMLAGRR